VVGDFYFAKAYEQAAPDWIPPKSSHPARTVMEHLRRRSRQQAIRYDYRTESTRQ